MRPTGYLGELPMVSKGFKIPQIVLPPKVLSLMYSRMSLLGWWMKNQEKIETCFCLI